MVPPVLHHIMHMLASCLRLPVFLIRGLAFIRHSHCDNCVIFHYLFVVDHELYSLVSAAVIRFLISFWWHLKFT